MRVDATPARECCDHVGIDALGRLADGFRVDGGIAGDWPTARLSIHKEASASSMMRVSKPLASRLSRTWALVRPRVDQHRCHRVDRLPLLLADRRVRIG